MRFLSATLFIALAGTASSDEAMARAVELCMGIPFDGVPVATTFEDGGWERMGAADFDPLVSAHACGDDGLASGLRAQFTQTLDFSGGLFRSGDVIALAADNRGGDILDRICFIAGPAQDMAQELMEALPVSADRAALGYTARETPPENFVEAYGWRGDHQIHVGQCGEASAVKIRRLMRRIPQ
ncbi:MAG: hypothetical protein AAF618_05190 [Pseudomonadota bacterium]